MEQRGMDDLQGCLLFAVLVVLAIGGWLVWLGWPASGGALALLIVFFALKGVKQAATQAEGTPPIFYRTLLKGGASGAAKAALWAAAGCGLVWIAQFVLAIFVHDPDPDRIGAIELRIADTADMIRALMTPGIVAGIFLIVFLVALAVDRLWPIGAASWAKKWAGNLVALAAAVTAFSFVGAQVAGERYDKPAAILRARIVGDLKALVKARQAGAAFGWLTDLAEQADAAPRGDADRWRRYFEEPIASCESDQAAYEKGYGRSAYTSSLPERRHYCDPDVLTAELARQRLTVQTQGGDPAPAAGWLPEFRSLIVKGAAPDPYDVDPFADAPAPADPSLDLAPKVTRIGELRELAVRVHTKLNDASQARDALRGAATGAVGKLLKGALPETVERVAGYWISPLLDEVAKKGASRLGDRLRKTRLARNPALGALLGVDEASAALVAPTSGGKEGQEIYRQMRVQHRIRTDLDPDQLAEYGRRIALADEARERSFQTFKANRGAEIGRPEDRPREIEREHPAIHGL